jgi:RimJ/RimL family protein N-acetyltransferase
MVPPPARPPVPPPVRRLGADDWGALARARLTALADAPEAFYSTLAAEEHRTEAEWRVGATTAAWFGALDGDGAPAGLVAVVHGGPPPGDAMLISMWVAAAYRGAGLAAELVAAALDAAAGAGEERLTLWVRTGNVRAIRAYERMGFVLQDPPPDAHDYRCEGELFMARPVSAEGR